MSNRLYMSQPQIAAYAFADFPDPTYNPYKFCIASDQGNKFYLSDGTRWIPQSDITGVGGLLVGDQSQAANNSAAIQAAIDAANAMGGGTVVVTTPSTRANPIYINAVVKYRSNVRFITAPGTAVKYRAPDQRGPNTGTAAAGFKNAALLDQMFTVISSMTTVAVFSGSSGTAIPTTPFQITPTVPNSGTWVADYSVTTTGGAAMTRVTGTPQAGQYSVAAGVYTFSAADRAAGLSVIFNFFFTSATDPRQSVLVTTATAHNKAIGDMISVWGASSTAYNGIFRTLATPSTTTLVFTPDKLPAANSASVSVELAQLRLYTPDENAHIEIWGDWDQDIYYITNAAYLNDPGNPNGLGGPVDHSTGTAQAFTNCDNFVACHTFNCSFNCYGKLWNSGEHAVLITQSKNFSADVINIGNASADGLHLTGPLTACRFGLVSGYSRDNLLAPMTCDYSAASGSGALSQGDLIDCSVEHLHILNTPTHPFRIVGNAGFTIQFRIGQATGTTRAVNGGIVFIDTLMVPDGNVNIDLLQIDRWDVQCQYKDGVGLLIAPATGKKIVIGHQSLQTLSSATVLVALGNGSDSVNNTAIDEFIHNGIDAKAFPNGYAIQGVQIFPRMTVKHMTIRDAIFGTVSGNTGDCVTNVGGTVYAIDFFDGVFENCSSKYFNQSSATVNTKVNFHGGYHNVCQTPCISIDTTRTPDVSFYAGTYIGGYAMAYAVGGAAAAAMKVRVTGTISTSTSWINNEGNGSKYELYGWEISADPAYAGVQTTSGQFCKSSNAGAFKAGLAMTAADGHWYAIASNAGVNTQIV